MKFIKGTLSCRIIAHENAVTYKKDTKIFEAPSKIHNRESGTAF